MATVCCLYLVLVCIVYTITQDILMTFPISLIAILAMAISMEVGAAKLALKLDSESNQRNTTMITTQADPGRRGSKTIPVCRRGSNATPVCTESQPGVGARVTTSQSRRIIKYSRKVALRMFLLFLSTVGFIFTALDPSYGAVTCTCAFLQLWSVLSTCECILKYINKNNFCQQMVNRLLAFPCFNYLKSYRGAATQHHVGSNYAVVRPYSPPVSNNGSHTSRPSATPSEVPFHPSGARISVQSQLVVPS